MQKSPSSIHIWDFNPQPSEHESPHITTKPHNCYTIKQKVRSFKIVSFWAKNAYLLCKGMCNCIADFLFYLEDSAAFIVLN